MQQIFFLAGLSLLFTHELDAIRVQEWRIFPGLDRLSEQRGYLVFTASHVPLFLILLWAVYGDSSAPNRAWMDGLSSFFIVHTGLHLLALRHPHNGFTSILSWTLIGGAGLCGALHLLLERG